MLMERLGRYQLVKKLAMGGMAEIFLAKLKGAAGFEKEVVVKRILPQWSQHPDFVAMLIDEAKIAVRLSHPHIVPVHELGREGDVYYIAMEYVPGTDVRKLMKQPLPEDVALPLAIAALEGLGYAHRFGVIHRDISPQNLLVSEDGLLKITDFGIAQAASKTHETATGVIKGKYAYMSPEQASQRELDGRSDLFALAIVLYEMLTAERLFYAGSDIATLDRVRRAEIQPSPNALKLISEPLWAILRRALARRPEDRYADAPEFREALEDYAREKGLFLRRERVADYLAAVLPKTIPDRRDEATPVLSGATEVLIEETLTAIKEFSEISEILAERSQTRLLIDDATQVIGRTFPSSRKIPISLMMILIGLAVVVALFSFRAGKRVEKTTIAETVVPLLPKLPQRPQPVEISDPPVAVPAPESLPESQKAPETAVAVSMLEEGPAAVVGLKPAKAEEAKKRDRVEEKVSEKGYVSVQAVPWGTIHIDGGKRRWETPIRRIPLSPGRHTVRVTYDPDGSVLSSSITVLSGKEIVCVAKFRGGKELRCKN